VVFLAIGFETTIAPVITLIRDAEKNNIKNISLLVAFKLVPPALTALAEDPDVNVHAFLCPAHVSAIIGADAYLPFVNRYGIPCVVAGFEPLDILYGIDRAAAMLADEKAELVNQYNRVVKAHGNRAALVLFDKYLKPEDAAWRGLGIIKNSGLAIKSEYSQYDAAVKFGIKIKKGLHDPRCRCADVLKGKILPSECAMFDRACTPLHPLGPCMVSSEGSCAAYYKYAR
jgi:hydrogenase expression/formation protein HypD